MKTASLLTEAECQQVLTVARRLISPAKLVGDIDDKICNAVDTIEFDNAGTRLQRESLAFLRGFAEAHDVTLLTLIDEARNG